ncbi:MULTISPECIES: aldose 1-epimerase family protein [Terrisporobacter]|uniref:Aldose 1-epimerase family protein n=1 Tax=Terrisporobacter muris TaxID=2963284 RepID=A0A9X2S2H8_9FIRM|nr:MULTISPECIES: aldose 1-epimerase family protein [Terrisporobacter]MCR1822092.1 aldose 1-epimerase family protein [Terrisporobacter muris]MDY3371916.1 aldose 1-epimerase family protein [Terrisporobacter othiniensis]
MSIKLMDKRYSKRDLMTYFGDCSSVAGVRRYSLSEGRAKGCNIIEITTGSGLTFEINETRGMDLGRCSYKSVPIAYQGYNREVHSNYYETFSDGWLRSFAGGLLVTCGLKSIGTPEEDKGEILPLHGRISNTPAERVNIEEYWEDEKLYFKIFGKMRESKALNYNLELKRTIFVQAGTNRIIIDDVVENAGFNEEEFMLLYHFNIGHPILDNTAKLLTHSKEVLPRDKDAKEQNEHYNSYLGPTQDYKDIVYYHNLEDYNDVCTAAIINEEIEMGITLKFNKSELDCFTQWKFTGLGNYVAGIEPGNARVNGRSAEREEGRLKTIKGNEEKHFRIEIEILTSKEEIDLYKKKYIF